MNIDQSPQRFFYENRDNLTRYAAREIIRLVDRTFGPISSVVDVGCGVGTWLAVAAEYGAITLKGFEGEWAKDNPFTIAKDQIEIVDLEQEWEICGEFDLGVCLEVAEHLTAESGVRLIRTLVGTSKVILFSAGVPGQGGNGHLNDQWPNYWQKEFSKYGFMSLDLIRPHIIRDEKIPLWYRQNIFIVVPKAQAIALFQTTGCTPGEPEILGLNFREIPGQRAQPNTGLKSSLRQVFRALIEKYRRL